MTQRIEPFSFLKNMTQRMELFFKKWLKELIFFWNMTHTIEPLVMNLFFNMTQRIELFCFLDLIFTVWLREFNFWKKKKKTYWRKELNLTSWVWRKELNPLQKYDSKNRTFFSKEKDSKNWTFWEKWLKELNLFFSNTTQRIEFFFNTTHRIEPFLLVYDAKNWTLFLELHAQNWTLFFEYDAQNWTVFWIGLKELNSFW